MSVQKFLGTIETDGIKDERGIETPSLSATGEVAGQTGVFAQSVTAPSFEGNLTGTATNATNDGEGNNIQNTYATKEALTEETSAREAADETLSKGITAEASARASAIEDIIDGTTVVAKATGDGSGNNIAQTYATQNALSSGLAGKANTSGTYPNITAGNATNAANLNGFSGAQVEINLATGQVVSGDLLQTMLLLVGIKTLGAHAAVQSGGTFYGSSRITAYSQGSTQTIQIMFNDTQGVTVNANNGSVSAIGDFPMSGSLFISAAQWNAISGTAATSETSGAEEA